MLLLAKRIIGIVDKKKKTCCYVLLVVLFNILGSAFYKYEGIIRKNQDTSHINTAKIEDLERAMSYQESFSSDVVKRKSFNAYIERKDFEYHNQMVLNNLFSSKIGKVEGKISVIYEAIGIYNNAKNLTKQDNDD